MERDTIVVMVLVLLLIFVVGSIVVAFLPEQYTRISDFAKGVFGLGGDKESETHEFVAKMKDLVPLCEGSDDTDCMCEGKFPYLPSGYFITVQNKDDGAYVTAFSKDNVPLGKTQFFSGYKIGTALIAYNKREPIQEGLEGESFADGACVFKDNFVIMGDVAGRPSIALGEESGAFYKEAGIKDILKVSDGKYCLVTENIEQEDFPERKLRFDIYHLDDPGEDYDILYKGLEELCLTEYGESYFDCLVNYFKRYLKRPVCAQAEEGTPA